MKLVSAKNWILGAPIAKSYPSFESISNTLSIFTKISTKLADAIEKRQVLKKLIKS